MKELFTQKGFTRIIDEQEKGLENRLSEIQIYGHTHYLREKKDFVCWWKMAFLETLSHLKNPCLPPFGHSPPQSAKTAYSAILSLSIGTYI